MRIGIDFRFLSAGRRAVNRGWGRYTQQQVREVLRLDHQSEYLLFCRRDADLGALLPEIAEAANVAIVWLSPQGSRGEDRNRAIEYLTAAAELDRALDTAALDLFHVTTPCRLDDLVVARIDACPSVATLYDLIPLAFPEGYYPPDTEPELASWYRRGLSLLRHADQLIAISASSRVEAMRLLGLPGDRIQVAQPVAEPCFRRLPEVEREARMATLRPRHQLGADFVVAVSHLHHAKNLPCLLDAWAQLPVGGRPTLVLPGDFSPSELATLRRWAAERGVEEALRPLGFVADDDLVALYNAASLVVHPSRAEGFGLPVLEAMACGAAVLAASASALPEVVGDGGELFDPDQPADLARRIAGLLATPERRRALGARGLARVAGQRPAELGEATLAAYAAAARSHRPAGRRLAVWTPLPPQPSGVADYAAELIAELAKAATVEIFVDDGTVPAAEIYAHAAVHHHGEFARRAARHPFDTVLYQLGANFLHLYMADAIARWPGVVTLHDLSWGAVLHRLHALAGTIDELLAEVAWSEGAAARLALEAVEATPEPALAAARETFFNQHPVLRRVLTASRAAVVHWPRGAAELTARYGHGAIHSFPMGVADPCHPGRDVATLRRELDLPPAGFVIGAFGIADPVKRLASVVTSLRQLRDRGHDARLLIVGAFPDLRYQQQLRQLTAELELAPSVRILGRVDGVDFERLLIACDVVVNLRWPFRQQMSATLMRGLAAGKPVIVSDLPAWDHLPACCLRVAPNATEVTELTRHLALLANDPVARERLGREARLFYEREATVSRMASHYLRMVEELAASEAGCGSARARAGDAKIGSEDPTT